MSASDRAEVGKVGQRLGAFKPALRKGFPNLPNLPNLASHVHTSAHMGAGRRRRACVRAHAHQFYVGKVGKVRKSQQGQGFRASQLIPNLEKVGQEVELGRIEAMRQSFREVRRVRMAEGDWSRADADEASASIAEAIRSGDKTRIDDAETWIGALLKRVRA